LSLETKQVSDFFNKAVKDAVSKGVVMVVAAGNGNVDACSVSPASTASAITVGSTSSTDLKSSFSNWGSCVDVYAPGTSITSAWISSSTANTKKSGTSMASPRE
jgi:subtilisin family serine protease